MATTAPDRFTHLDNAQRMRTHAAEKDTKIRERIAAAATSGASPAEVFEELVLLAKNQGVRNAADTYIELGKHEVIFDLLRIDTHHGDAIERATGSGFQNAASRLRVADHE